MEEVKVAYELGVQAGIKLMMDKIENHYKQGKPVLANGRLYWMKNDIQHLYEVMDSLEDNTEEFFHEHEKPVLTEEYEKVYKAIIERRKMED